MQTLNLTVARSGGRHLQLQGHPIQNGRLPQRFASVNLILNGLNSSSKSEIEKVQLDSGALWRSPLELISFKMAD